jgi:hypothetical protein
MMTLADRKRIRTLQNKIIKLAEKRQFGEYTRISTDMPAEITMFNLRRMIYPSYEGNLRDVLFSLQSAR